MSGNRLKGRGQGARGRGQGSAPVQCLLLLPARSCRSINQSNCKATCNKTGQRATLPWHGGGDASGGQAQCLCLINVAVVRCRCRCRCLFSCCTYLPHMLHASTAAWRCAACRVVYFRFLSQSTSQLHFILVRFILIYATHTHTTTPCVCEYVFIYATN